MCPSTVDKSTQPCPILSSSLAPPTALISNGNPIPRRTDTISLSSSSSSHARGTKPSTFLLRSSLDHPADYHTNRRIEDLHERMDDIQVASFVQFLNHHLPTKSKRIETKTLAKDLSNGHVLLDLIEILSASKLKRERGQTRFHALTNVQYVLDYLKSRLHHVNISPHEIVSGNRKQILALLWIIMKTFDFPGFRLTTNRSFFSEQTLLGGGQDRSVVIKWLNHLLGQSLNRPDVQIKDFYLQTWIDASYLSIIVKYLLPISKNYLTQASFDYLKQIDETNRPNRDRFQTCLDLSHHCFATVPTVDFNDKTERSLFKYFTEFQTNVFASLKTNAVANDQEKNPYVRQLLNSISSSTEHSSIMNHQEQYLICIDDDQKELLPGKQHTRLAMNSIGHSTSSSSSSDDGEDVPQLRTVEKSRLFTDQQHKATLTRRNRWNPPSEPPSADAVTREPITDAKNMQPALSNDARALGDNEETIVSIDNAAMNDNLEQSILSNDESEQLIDVREQPDQVTVTTQDRDPAISEAEQTRLVDEPTEASAIANEQREPSPVQQETIDASSSDATLTASEKTNEVIGVCIKNGRDEQLIQAQVQREEPAVPSASTTFEYANGVRTASVDEDVQVPVDLEEIVELTSVEVQSVPITNGSCEQSHADHTDVEETPEPVVIEPVNNDTQTVAIEPSVPADDGQEVVSASQEDANEEGRPVREMEPSEPIASVVAIEQSPTQINGHVEQAVIQPKASPQQLAAQIPIEPQSLPTSNGDSPAPMPCTETSATGPDHLDNVIEVPKASTPIVDNQVPSSAPKRAALAKQSIQKGKHSTPRAASTAIKEQQPAPLTSAIEPCLQSSATIKNDQKDFKHGHHPPPSKPEHVVPAKTNGTSSAVSNGETSVPLPVAEEKKSVVISMDVKTPPAPLEPSVQVARQEEASNSSAKNKKSRRSNDKKAPSKQVTHPASPVITYPEEKIEPVLLAPQPIAPTKSETPAPSTTKKASASVISEHEKPAEREIPSPQPALHARKNNKKKKPSLTPADKPSLPLISSSNTLATANRNIFVVVKECLRDPKSIALKYVFFLFCFCFTLIILIAQK